jgi:hypothetical protein
VRAAWAVECVVVVRVRGVAESKWDVCSQQGQRLAWAPKESKCGGRVVQRNRASATSNVPATVRRRRRRRRRRQQRAIRRVVWQEKRRRG